MNLNDIDSFEFSHPLNFEDQISIDDFMEEWKKFIKKRELEKKRELRVKKLNKINEK